MMDKLKEQALEHAIPGHRERFEVAWERKCAFMLDELGVPLHIIRKRCDPGYSALGLLVMLSKRLFPGRFDHLD